MKKIEILTEFMHNPVWYCDEDGIETNDFRPFERFIKDDQINELSKTIENLNNSYYELNSHDEEVYFNESKEKEDSVIMLNLLKQLIKRINELNDNEFEIIDSATKYYSKLSNSIYEEK